MLAVVSANSRVDCSATGTFCVAGLIDLARRFRSDRARAGPLDRRRADHAETTGLPARSQREIKQYDGRHTDRSDCGSHDHPDLLIATLVFHSIVASTSISLGPACLNGFAVLCNTMCVASGLRMVQIVRGKSPRTPLDKHCFVKSIEPRDIVNVIRALNPADDVALAAKACI